MGMSTSTLQIPGMYSSLQCFLTFLLLAGGLLATNSRSDGSFDKNYDITWGYHHVVSLDQGREIELSMDNSSGSGFGSKESFGSGFFHMSIKLPGKDSAGVVTAFYLTSHGDNHDELDFEFLGNLEGKPIVLQTNVFANGKGNREQKVNLWFDPTADFHTYKILWNPHQIVFYVDSVPIRVFKNKTSIGVGYPSRAMQIQASLWDGDSWATDGGRIKTNWSQAPFKANFQGFDITGCSVHNSNVQPCYSSSYWWNTEQYWKLEPEEQAAYENVKNKYVTYDYCFDKNRFPITPQECPQ